MIAQHTRLEESALRRHAARRKCLVEIGVAEGASALALRQVAHPSGVLYLIDPYPAGRVPGVCLTKACAQRYVNRSHNATVHFLEDYSYRLSKSWQRSIDFLFIDGDHSYEACMKDWNEWSPFVEQDGVVAFHDARTWTGGWAAEDEGPVKVVNELFRQQNNPRWKLIDEIDSLVVIQRTA